MGAVYMLQTVTLHPVTNMTRDRIRDEALWRSGARDRPPRWTRPAPSRRPRRSGDPHNRDASNDAAARIDAAKAAAQALADGYWISY
jgi:hypothetical protein